MCQHVPVTSETTHEFYEPWYDHPVVFYGHETWCDIKARI